jgi:hypothetical protein
VYLGDVASAFMTYGYKLGMRHGHGHQIGVA